MPFVRSWMICGSRMMHCTVSNPECESRMTPFSGRDYSEFRVVMTKGIPHGAIFPNQPARRSTPDMKFVCI
jgi:hypothetical protein